MILQELSQVINDIRFSQRAFYPLPAGWIEGIVDIQYYEDTVFIGGHCTFTQFRNNYNVDRGMSPLYYMIWRSLL